MLIYKAVVFWHEEKPTQIWLRRHPHKDNGLAMCYATITDIKLRNKENTNELQMTTIVAMEPIQAAGQGKELNCFSYEAKGRASEPKKKGRKYHWVCNHTDLVWSLSPHENQTESPLMHLVKEVQDKKLLPLSALLQHGLWIGVPKVPDLGWAL